MEKIKFIGMGVAMLIIAAGCGQESTNNETATVSEEINQEKERFDLAAVTSPAFENMEVHKELVKVSNESGGTFKFFGGSSIEIPENCFSHLDGTPVEGEVSITFQEFNDLSDILLAGIDMRYDSAGVGHNFVSAGMFHIDGHQNGTPIQIVNNKEITVHTATNIPDIEDTPCYNFYTMSNNGEWEYKTTKKATPNPDYEEVEQLKTPEKPSNDDLVIETIISENEGPMYWKYAGNRPDTVNMKKLNSTKKNVRFEKTNKNQLSYDLIFTFEENTINVPVEPVYIGKDFDVAMNDFKRKMQRLENDQEALKAAAEGKYIRSIGVNSFGLFNWDKIYSGNKKPLLANFESGFDLSPSLIAYHQISKSANVILSHNSSSIKNTMYLPNDDNIFVATAPGNKVSYISSKAFFKAINNTKEGERTLLKFIPLEREIASPEALKDFIASLN